ncbi:hypothetical protein ADL07_13430 [Streptomyces sp. NRRL F-4707]|nr:hypothetical protein ADL07_13430 [Streptomyces sp. NRRL F-4707]
MRLARRRASARFALTAPLATRARTTSASTVICTRSGRKPGTASKIWLLAEAGGGPVLMDRVPLRFHPLRNRTGH